MSALALRPAADTLRSNRAVPQPLAVLAQRKSSLGGPGAITAPPISDAGRSLDAGTRSSMETGFGRDFSSIRVHDDARAHDNARNLGARAYAAGDHIVFGEGQYRPETAMGRALIAHELAHSVQQGGVQMKADGPLPAASDAELEGQADRAAAAVTAGRSAPALSRIGTAAVFRTAVGETSPTGSATSEKPGPTAGLPTGWSLVVAEPDASAPVRATLKIATFDLPEVKGPGSWVQDAYNEHQGRLAFMPVFIGESREPDQAMGAFKEGEEKYKKIWLAKYGFTSLSSVATAFTAAAETNPDIATLVKKPAVEAILTGFNTNKLTGAGCDIDHIVEKQLQGSSAPANLQLLGSSKNQTSGTNIFLALKRLVHSLDTSPFGRVRDLRIEFGEIKVKTDTDSEDGSALVEGVLRRPDSPVKGSDAVSANVKGEPVSLSAGSKPETVNIQKTGETDIDFNAKRLVPGMKLGTYTRSTAKGDDIISATLDHKVMKATGEKSQIITLLAQKPQIAAPPAAAVPEAGASATPAAAATEQRLVKLQPLAKGQAIGFYYPYMSKGEITELNLNAAGAISGKGVIHPTPKFLGDIFVTFGPDTLTLDKKIDVEALNESRLIKPISSIFRFTKGEVEFDLVNFVPKGELKFQFGAAARPWATGDLTVKRDGNTFAATGNLVPAAIPGIKEAKGTVAYNSEKGLTGELVASSAAIGGGTTTIDAKVGFKEAGGRFLPYATGGITAKVKEADLKLTMAWDGQGFSYAAKGRIPSPLPMIKAVDFDGTYKGGKLKVTGTSEISWKKISGIALTVTYVRIDGEEEGNFSGAAHVKTTAGQADLDFKLGFDEKGKWWADGSVAYPVTPNIKPKLKLGVDKTGLIKVSGGVDIASIALSKKWPGPNGGKATIIKGVGAKFSVPVPVPLPGVTVYGKITLNAGFDYSVGPVSLEAVRFEGSLYPLEDDPKIEASLSGKLALPATAGLYGELGADIGLEWLAGAAGASGGITVTPRIGLSASVQTPFSASYKGGAFSFAANAVATGKTELTMGVVLNAKIYALYGALSHVWVHKLNDYSWPLGSEMTLHLGSVGYNKDGVKWPSLSEIKSVPEIDPLGMVNKLLENAKRSATQASEAQKAEDAAMRREIARMNRGSKF